jgi:integrase
MARTPRKNKSGAFKDVHPVLDGMANIYRADKHGLNWQFRMFLKSDNQDYKCSLRTKDFESAVGKAQTLAIKLSGMVQRDIKVFGMTLSELVQEYLDYRMLDVETGEIVKGRWKTMKSQLNNMIRVKSGDIKLSELDRNCMYDYAQWRRLESPGVQDVTIRNETSTINAMIQFAYRQENIHFEKLIFKKMKIGKDDVGTRGTFTLDEYDKLIMFLRSYVSKKHCPDDKQRHERLMIRDYILISSNTYARPGELRQIVWSDIIKYEVVYDEPQDEASIMNEDDYDYTREQHLVHLNIRKEISKVRSARKVIARGGNYFQRLHKRTHFKEASDLVFEVNGKRIEGRTFMKHWSAIMTGMKFSKADYQSRKLAWYSFRHFGISCRVMAGVSLIDIAKLAGTSVHHASETYLKHSDELKKTAALKNFRIDDDGTLVHF